MKNLLCLAVCIVLTACGAIGIGSNHNTMVYNNSTDVITVSADSGIYKIKPDSALNIYSAEDITINSADKNCSQTNIVRQLNTPAVILDVFPGFFLGIIPILVDAVSNNLYKMPSTYSYSC